MVVQNQVKEKIFDKYGKKCVKCGFTSSNKTRFDIHHIVPQYCGGQDSLDNLVPLCGRCHRYAPDANIVKSYKKLFKLFIKNKQPPEQDLINFKDLIDEESGNCLNKIPHYPHRPDLKWIELAYHADYKNVRELCNLNIQVRPQKAKEAIERKKEKGEPLGPPPKGLKYSSDKTCFVPGQEFDKVIQAIKDRENGEKLKEIEGEHGIPPSTMSRIMDRKEDYMEKA